MRNALLHSATSLEFKKLLHEGNSPTANDFRKSLKKTGASSGAHSFRTITGIPSGPLDLEASRHFKILRTCRTVMETLERVAVVRDGKDGGSCSHH